MEDRIENIRRVLHQIKPSFRLQGEFERIAHGDVVPALANRVLPRQVGVDATKIWVGVAIRMPIMPQRAALLQRNFSTIRCAAQ